MHRIRKKKNIAECRSSMLPVPVGQTLLCDCRGEADRCPLSAFLYETDDRKDSHLSRAGDSADKVQMEVVARGSRLSERGLSNAVLAGSYTVEAAFLFPVLIVLMAFVLRLSIGLYGTVREAADDTQSVTELDTKEMFLNNHQIQDFLEKLT